MPHFTSKKTFGNGRPMLNFGRPIVKCTPDSNEVFEQVHGCTGGLVAHRYFLDGTRFSPFFSSFSFVKAKKNFSERTGTSNACAI